MKQGIVYVVQENNKHDMTSALAYGSMKLLLDAGDVVLSAAPTVRRLKQLLKDFCDDDHLLLTGDPVAIGIAVGVALNTNLGRAKILKWSKRANQYISLEIDTSGRMAQ